MGKIRFEEAFLKKFHPQWISIPLFVLAAFSLRLGFGLYASPVQPIRDEIQTYLLGLKYYATNAWPYYGNDVVEPTTLHLKVLTQNPGALQALLIGAPLRLWPSPVSPFILINILSMAGYAFLAWYACKRLPKLSPWFIFPWMMAAPWCLHYSTSMLNLSYTIAGACFFFVAFMESIPALSLGWMPLRTANLLMGFTAFWHMQLHGTWVLLPPFMLVSFFFQWKESDKITAPFFALLGALPLTPLIIPTLLLPDYHFFRDVSGLSAAFNPYNFGKFFTILVQFLAMVCFEMPRFIGKHTVDRSQFLLQHWSLVPGFFLWLFGFLQVLVLMVFGFDSRNPRVGWDPIRLLVGGTFLLIFTGLVLTAKSPDINTFYEMQPVVMIYSLYVWERCWSNVWARRVLWVFVAAVWIFQAGYLRVQIDQKESFYSIHHDNIVRAIQEKNYRILGERREGSFY